MNQTTKSFLRRFPEHWENIDNGGTHGTVFINEFIEELFAGRAFIVVDAPPILNGTDKYQQQAEKWRPYWNIYRTTQAINWRESVINNQTLLTQIVFKKCVNIPVGDFGEKEVFEYKAYRLTADGVSWAIFRHKDNDKAKDLELIQSGIIAGMKRLPVAIGRGSKTSIPPLKDLAYQNIRHFNKESDYDKADAYAGLVFPVATGDVKMEGLGSDLLIKCTDSDGSFELKETTGAALEAKRALLERIERLMDELGLSLLVDNAQVTATQVVISNAQKTSELARIATSAKDAIETAIEIHGDFMNVAKEQVCSIDLGFKADALVLSPNTAQMLLQASQAGKLSTFDFLSCLALGGVMPDGFNLDEAVKRILEETKQKQINDGGKPVS